MRRGFTLIEVVVALTIAGAVVAGAYGILLSVVRARDDVARERERLLPAVAARETLAGWLAGTAVMDGGGAFQGTDRRSGALPADELVFAVTDGGALYPGPRRIRLWMERGRGLRAEIAQFRGGADTLDLAPGAAGLDVKFRVRVEGVERWVDGWTSATRLPEAVELRILPAPESSDALAAPLRLPVRATLHTDSNAEATDDR